MVEGQVTVELERSLQQGVRGSGVDLGLPLLGQAGARSVGWRYHQVLYGAAQASRVRAELANHVRLIGRECRERARRGIEVQVHPRHRRWLASAPWMVARGMIPLVTRSAPSAVGMAAAAHPSHIGGTEVRAESKRASRIVPWMFLVLSALGAIGTLNALLPLRRPWWLKLASFNLGWFVQ